MTQEELEFRRRCPYDAFGDYSDVLKEIRQKEKENKTDTVSTSPKTGDNTPILFWILLAGVGMAGVGGTVILRKKKKK